MFSNSIKGWLFCNSPFGTQSWASGFCPMDHLHCYAHKGYYKDSVSALLSFGCKLLIMFDKEKGYWFKWNRYNMIDCLVFYAISPVLISRIQAGMTFWIKIAMKSQTQVGYNISLCWLSITQINSRLTNYISKMFLAFSNVIKLQSQ